MKSCQKLVNGSENKLHMVNRFLNELETFRIQNGNILV